MYTCNTCMPPCSLPSYNKVMVASDPSLLCGGGWWDGDMEWAGNTLTISGYLLPGKGGCDGRH